RHRVLAGLVAQLELELPAVVLAAVDDIAVARLTRGLQYQAGHLLRRAVDQRIAVDLDRPERLVATGDERSDLGYWLGAGRGRGRRVDRSRRRRRIHRGGTRRGVWRGGAVLRV